MVSFADLIGNLLSTAAAAGEYFPVLEEEEEADDGDDIYIMMECLSVCVSRKMITSFKGL